jgi:hypothetical protein
VIELTLMNPEIEPEHRRTIRQLRKFDTPPSAMRWSCARQALHQQVHATAAHRRFPKLLPIVGFARTVMIRCPNRSILFCASEAAGLLRSMAQPSALRHGGQDIDSQPGLGAFWGEVNTAVQGLGLRRGGNGSMRDLDAMHPKFQCIAATLSPSHGFVNVVDFGKPVDVLGLEVSDGDIVHADQHGAVAFRIEELEKIPAAIDLMARREKVILDAAHAPGFNMEKLRTALAGAEQVK